MKQIIVSIFIFSVFLISCTRTESHYIPKPKGYNRITLPSHSYQKLNENHPYSFDYSRSAVILPDTFAEAEPHWIFIYYPHLKANLQLTYKTIENNSSRLKDFIDDAYKLAAKHQKRASSIQEKIITSANGTRSTLFKLEGDVPSPYQFYTTDSTRHFLRGAIYFNTATQNDSLAPVIEYLHQDMLHLINTLRWR